MEIERLPVLFLAGTNFSGSTLMAFVGNAHPEIASIGEIGPAPAWEGPDYECSCGRRIVECPFFLEIRERLREQGIDFDLGYWDLRERYGPGDLVDRLVRRHLGLHALDTLRDRIADRFPPIRRRRAEYLRRNVAFMRAAVQAAGARVFFDTNKTPDRIALLSRSPNLDLKVLHLTRDPRAQVFSAIRHHPERDVAAQARAWRRRNLLIERQLARIPPRSKMRMRYEAFCERPEEHFQRLCDFIGVARMSLPDDLRSVPHHVTGNSMRKASAPLRIRRDDRWERSMSADLRATVLRRTAKLARRYGHAVGEVAEPRTEDVTG